MAIRAFDFPERTLEALEKLADITNVEADGRLARLDQDALRTYEWVLFQQAEGRSVVALEQPEVELLTQSRAVHGERESLAPFLAPDKLQQARQFFLEDRKEAD